MYIYTVIDIENYEGAKNLGSYSTFKDAVALGKKYIEYLKLLNEDNDGKLHIEEHTESFTWISKYKTIGIKKELLDDPEEINFYIGEIEKLQKKN